MHTPSDAMETRAGGPGAFARFDLNRVPSPAFVVDEAAILRNLAILKDVGVRGNACVLLALKAFSMWSLADVEGLAGRAGLGDQVGEAGDLGRGVEDHRVRKAQDLR